MDMIEKNMADNNESATLTAAEIKEVFDDCYEFQDNEMIVKSLVNFSNKNLRGHDLRGYSFFRAILINTDLSNADLRGVGLQKAILTGANLSNANLSQAHLEGANLEDAILKGATLTGADLQSTNLTRADLRDAKLENVKLNKSILHRAKLNNASLEKASLNNANLRLAKLCNVNFKDADLYNTNLANADLQDADFAGADLYQANLEGTILSKEETAQQIKDVAKADPANIQEVAASQLAINSKYYENALQQSKQSFISALIWTVIGTGLIIASIGFILIQGQSNLPYLSFIGGTIVEAIAGLNFYLYGRASLQLTAFQAPLERTGRFLIANSICENLEGETKQQTRAKLVETIANVPTMLKTSDKDK